MLVIQTKMMVPVHFHYSDDDISGVVGVYDILILKKMMVVMKLQPQEESNPPFLRTC